MHGNPAELREMMTNLIFNAVDAMPSGGTLTLRTLESPGGVVVEIADTGAGMTPEVRARCLDPFFSTKGDKGTGLGLAMVFGIVQRQQGQIDIESTPGVGTTFRITLPVNVDEVALAAEGSALEESLAEVA
jgi:signal transduction histidine kinase